jgi:hypothetical protein
MTIAGVMQAGLTEMMGETQGAAGTSLPQNRPIANVKPDDSNPMKMGSNPKASWGAKTSTIWDPPPTPMLHSAAALGTFQRNSTANVGKNSPDTTDGEHSQEVECQYNVVNRMHDRECSHAQQHRHAAFAFGEYSLRRPRETNGSGGQGRSLSSEVMA